MANDDAKEWVTIKVPKAVRDDAQDDPRTYEEIMRAGLDSDNLGDRLRGALEGDGDPIEEIKNLRGRGGDGLPDDLRDQLDRIEAAATTAEDRTGSIESTLEAMGGRR